MEKKQRKKQRAEKDFKRLVKKYIDRGKLNATATFEEAEGVCGERSAWKDVAADSRPEIFAKLIEVCTCVRACACVCVCVGACGSSQGTGRGRRMCVHVCAWYVCMHLNEMGCIISL